MTYVERLNSALFTSFASLHVALPSSRHLKKQFSKLSSPCRVFLANTVAGVLHVRVNRAKDLPAGDVRPGAPVCHASSKHV